MRRHFARTAVLGSLAISPFRSDTVKLVSRACQGGVPQHSRGTRQAHVCRDP